MIRMKYCGNIDLEYLEGTIVSNMVNKHIKEIEKRFNIKRCKNGRI